MHFSNQSRRSFLESTSCAGLGYFTFMNTLTNLRTLNAASIANSTVAAGGTGYKAIVCILLAGGNDSFNMLVPYDDDSHNDYVDIRQGLYTAGGSGLAIPKSELANTVLNYSMNGKQWALHPSMVDIKDLFHANKVAFLSNIGTINQPTTLAQYDNRMNLPLGLFSHSDQIEEWQTGTPHLRSVKGWGGKMADLIRDCNANQQISMNVSLSGSNLWQQGNETVEYAISANNGPVGIKDYDPSSSNFVRQVRTAALDGLMSQEYQNIFRKTYSEVITGARDSFLQFEAALANSIQFSENEFPDSNLGESLEMIARVIDVRDQLQFQRQTFFVTAGGWDHHDEVIVKQQGMLAGVGAALSAFQTALGPGKVNVENEVLTMIISEFGRTLSSNGNGSDHAWGGNTFVMGGPELVDGGKIFGQYPSMSEINPDPQLIARRGRFIPTLSTDEYFAEIARWFGVPNADLSLLFPNIGAFYDTSSNLHPIGFLKA